MSVDDENRFRPKPGRIRSDTPRTGRPKSFLTQAKTIARQHSNGPSRSSSRSSPRPRSSTGATGGKVSRAPRGPGVQCGRGAAFVRARTLLDGWCHTTPGVRRVVVKARYVQNAGKHGKAAAHLRYIQRNGTSRDGQQGQLYSATEDRADGSAFLERGQEDRHQFRFIISPEDGADLSDLTAYTRDLMGRIEADLGTRLDWVAVNHYNTGHPQCMSSSGVRTISTRTLSSTATISPTAFVNAAPSSFGQAGEDGACDRACPRRVGVERADGATWLDGRLVASDAADLAPAGFGQQVRDAMERRREHHIERGDATRQQNGRVFSRRNLLATLREREVASVGTEMAASKALPFRAATDGETGSGRFTGIVQLSSGKFAIVEQAHEFTLVPWRPVIDRHLGREVTGMVQAGSVSWQLGRQRELGL